MAILRGLVSRHHVWGVTFNFDLSAAVFIFLLLVPRISVTEIVPTTKVSQITTSQIPSHNSTSPNPKATSDYYDCPVLCSCHYDPSQQHLKITCRKTANPTSSSTPATNNHPTPNRIFLTNGVLRLGINYITVDYNILKALTTLPTAKTFALVELNLHHVTIDPTAFVTSGLLKSSIPTLRKLRICNVNLHPTATIPETDDPNFTSSAYTHLHLDSLSLCNSPEQLTHLLLAALPAVAHLSVTNASLSTLDNVDLSRLGGSLQTLDLSHNAITSLPWGFLAQVPGLISLDLSQNSLQHLQEQVFVGLTALKKLNVSHNRIKYADGDVFTPLISLHSLDLSQNELIQIFEPYFQDNVELRILVMRRTWAHDSFLPGETGTRSLSEMDKLIDTLERIETLDLRDNEMRLVPESLSHLRHLRRVYLSGNSWSCSCFDRWVLNWLESSSLANETYEEKEVLCAGAGLAENIISFIGKLNCTNTAITARTPRKYYGIQGTSKILKCHPQKKGYPKIHWSLPRTAQTLSSTTPTQPYVTDNLLFSAADSSYYRVLSNGDLHISNLTTEAFGLYICVAEYPDLKITHFIHLGVDTSIFLDVKYASIVIGWLTSFGFLVTVLTIQLVRLVLSKNGIDCPNITTPYKARRIRRFFESMEQHKNSQLEWLRDNYNQQVKRVKDNCQSQVERIRESYTVQTKNLSDIRDYGAQQIQTVREQYHDQIRRVSCYSTQQLCKVRENYVFQRNRVGKFSSHQMLRLRETYKWQAQAVNKILENLPKTLNFDSCRGVGACGRTDSMYFDELLELRGEVGLISGENNQFLDAQGISLFSVTDPESSLFKPKPDHVTVTIPSSSTSESHETILSGSPGADGDGTTPITEHSELLGMTNEDEEDSNETVFKDCVA